MTRSFVLLQSNSTPFTVAFGDPSLYVNFISLVWSPSLAAVSFTHPLDIHQLFKEAVIPAEQKARVFFT